jgi:hypothetical protein
MIAAPHGTRLLQSLVVGGALLSAACASANKSGTAGTESRPRLRFLRPDSVQLIPGNVTEVDLRGSGFDTSRAAPQNTVRIGTLVLRGVPSAEGGGIIRVAIPAAVPGNGEAPPMPWMGGRYAVTVTTPRGTSDTLMLAIATHGGRLP